MFSMDQRTQVGRRSKRENAAEALQMVLAPQIVPAAFN